MAAGDLDAARWRPLALLQLDEDAVGRVAHGDAVVDAQHPRDPDPHMLGQRSVPGSFARLRRGHRMRRWRRKPAARVAPTLHRCGRSTPSAAARQPRSSARACLCWITPRITPREFCGPIFYPIEMIGFSADTVVLTARRQRLDRAARFEPSLYRMNPVTESHGTSFSPSSGNDDQIRRLSHR